MITNPEKLAAFEAASRAKDKLTLEQKFAILDSLYQEARRMGHFTQADILQGIETDIRLAAALNTNVRIPPRKNR